MRGWIAWLLTAMVIAVAFGACTTELDESDDTEVKVETSITADIPELVEPFESEELPSIQGNEMHELHFADGVVCGECHLSSEPLPLARAHEICADCHPGKPIEKPVWNSHCLSCHFFTQKAQEAAGNPVEIGDALCHECHGEDEKGWMLFAACPFKEHDGEISEIFCSRCHRPHQTAEPVAKEICVECHSEFTGAKHLNTEEADCTLCHRPHRVQAAASTLCITCHGQAKGEIVHTIEQHPDDCLVCHNAHFSAIEIKGICDDCHEGMVYNAAPYQPKAHLDCKNCHHLDDFSVSGNSACRSCHAGHTVSAEHGDKSHAHNNCRNCHPQHTWRVPSSRRCERCHESVEVFEHQAVYHPDKCLACHDPHRLEQLPASGNCNGCHGNDFVPDFGAGAPDAHKVCANCHSDEQIASRNYGIMSPKSSCLQCHTNPLPDQQLSWNEIPEGHLFCAGCHDPHSGALSAVEQSCQLCHVQGDETPNEWHAACLNCHQADHGFGFVGVEESCRLCHAELPEMHDPELTNQCTDCHVLH